MGRKKAASKADGALVQDSDAQNARDSCTYSDGGKPLLDVLMVGVDEAGRGPLAGPVVASAVVLDPAYPISGLKDSKKLSARQREFLAPQIREHALAWAVAYATPAEIDRINILKATLLAMHRAVQEVQKKLNVADDALFALVDGNRLPAWPYNGRAIVKGDALEPAISAASILAKTERDAYMLKLHQTHPVYGFDAHMGYPTATHLQALSRFGPCHEHRRSFGPVRQVLDAAQPDLF